jgi:hypothetical protein
MNTPLFIGLILHLGLQYQILTLVCCPNSVGCLIEAFKEGVSSMLLVMDDSMKTDFGTNNPLPTLAFFEGRRVADSNPLRPFKYSLMRRLKMPSYTLLREGRRLFLVHFVKVRGPHVAHTCSDCERLMINRHWEDSNVNQAEILFIDYFCYKLKHPAFGHFPWQLLPWK